MKKEIVSSPFDAIVTHKYLERKGKPFFLLTNIQKLDQVDCFMLLLDMGERLCTYDDDKYQRLLPVFTEMYAMIGDAEAEVKFINEQRKKVYHGKANR